MAIQLYDYQEKLVNDARQSYANGFRAPCIVAPCGAGKSVMIAEIIRLSTMNQHHVLFLVHRRELLEQIENTLVNHGVDMNFVTLGMVMTVVNRLGTYPKFNLIVIDENHHTLAKSYKKIIDYFDTYVLGFTATPIRLNGDGLGDVNDTLIIGPTPKWLIDNERLAPYEYYSVDLTDKSKLKKSSTGDYTNQSMDDAIGKTIYGDVVKHYRKLADGQKTILYAHNIEYSKTFARQFNESGIPASHIDAKTPKAERQAIIERFRKGEIKVLCNVDLIGEGFDVPDCTAVILMRPTQSLSLFIQQSMRPMRYQPDKTATIIDHVGNVYRHGFPDMEREWTLDKKKKQKRQVVDAYPIWECDKCLMVFAKDTIKDNICPNCGCVKEVQQENKKEIDTTVELQKLERSNAEKEFYKRRNWRKAKSYSELKKIADANGYKSSWAAFKAKELKLSDTPQWVYRYESKQPRYNFNF
ncbi:DEAD/DEAH box helicase [Aerococcaceae bacterium zg-ZUI334]|nr:DEAD/DEAH box helicase [Aerococcaceae bacterium zg-ZUI334]